MIYFIDFEASSLLPGSFPIEIAWVDANGQGESYLIRPAVEWLAPADGWNGESERVHGISMEMLMDQGVPHELVASRTSEALGCPQSTACSDSPPFDGLWLRKLLKETGIRRSVPIAHVNTIYGLACRPLLDLLPLGDGPARQRAEARVRNMAKETVERAEEAEALRPRVHHRALPDAESLWRTWKAIREDVARRLDQECVR